MRLIRRGSMKRRAKPAAKRIAGNPHMNLADQINILNPAKVAGARILTGDVKPSKQKTPAKKRPLHGPSEARKHALAHAFANPMEVALPKDAIKIMESNRGFYHPSPELKIRFGGEKFFIVDIIALYGKIPVVFEVDENNRIIRGSERFASGSGYKMTQNDKRAFSEAIAGLHRRYSEFH